MAQQNHSSNGKPRQIITKGYLMKQGNLLNKSFKKKYFILYQGRTLSHFETHGCAKQIGEIDLSHVSQITYRDNIKTTSKCKYAFDVITPSKTWTLGCADQHECEEWVGHLRESAFGNTLFSGWLYKRGGKVQTWKHRFCVLSDTKILRYYEDEECAKYKGCIFLNDVIKIQTGDHPQQEHDNIIYLTTPSRIWCISAESTQSQQEWIEKLNDGQNQINYDEKASIFVNINKQNVKCRGNVDNGTCLAIERIKFVCCIYAKWIKSHEKQQLKDRQLRASMEQRHSAIQFKRANTTKIHSYSTEGSVSDETITSQRSLPELNLRARTTDLYAMKVKYKLRRGMYGIINNDLKEYSNKELLNDFNHILEQHHTAKKFELLCQYLHRDRENNDDEATSDDEQKEDRELPLSVLRVYRSRHHYSDEANHSDREELYFNYNDVCEIAMQQVLDKIYCHLFHSVSVCRLSKLEMTELEKQRQSEAIANDDDETYINCQEHSILNTKRLLDDKREALMEAETKHKLQLRYNKFIAWTESKTTETLQSVREDDEDPDEAEGKKESDIDDRPCHVFGNRRFFYWESCKNEAFYVAAKYNSLKEELLNNSLCNLSLPQFDTISHKCNDLHDTDRALIIGAFSGWKIGSGIQRFVQRYGIEEGTPIKKHHIIASVMYCNYYQFAENYRSTYQATHEAKHNEFAHFSRYLVECVLVFGASITNKTSLYHGMDGEGVILYDLSAKYIAPLSMTRYFEVAWSYHDSRSECDKDGLIVKLTQEDNLSAFNMDCSWLSDFVFECERIVVANAEPMRVDTIINRKEYRNYSVYIHAINSLSNLIASTKPIYLTNEVTKRALNKMITSKFGNKQKQKQKLKLMPPYIDRLFESKCLMVSTIECDCRQICLVMNKDNDDNNGCYSIFRSLLIDPGDDWIKIDLFVRLFPNLCSVTIRCFNHLTFNQNTASKLFNVLRSKMVRRKQSFRIEWSEPNECDMSYLEIVKKYAKVFEKLNYQMVSVNESIILIRKEHLKKRKKSKKHVQTVNNIKGSNDPIDAHDVIDDADCILM